MSFESLLIHTVTVSTPTGFGPATDRYGNPDEALTITPGVPCRIEPAEGQGGNREIIIDRDTRINRFRAFFLPDAPVNALSTLTWGTRTLRVSADPEYVYDGVGLHHFETECEEILG